MEKRAPLLLASLEERNMILKRKNLCGQAIDIFQLKFDHAQDKTF